MSYIKNRPFYEMEPIFIEELPKKYDITWDGDTTGRVQSILNWSGTDEAGGSYKISDISTVSIDDLYNSIITITNGTEIVRYSQYSCKEIVCGNTTGYRITFKTEKDGLELAVIDVIPTPGDYILDENLIYKFSESGIYFAKSNFYVSRWQGPVDEKKLVEPIKVVEDMYLTKISDVVLNEEDWIEAKIKLEDGTYAIEEIEITFEEDWVEEIVSLTDYIYINNALEVFVVKENNQEVNILESLHLSFKEKGIYKAVYLYQNSSNFILKEICPIKKIDKKFLPSIEVSDMLKKDEEKPISSGAVYQALGSRSQLNFDNTPTYGSNNLMTSNSIYQAFSNYSPPTVNYVDSAVSTPISSKGVYTALGNRYTLPNISTTVNNSSDLITSGAIYKALGERSELTFSASPSPNSSSLMTAGAIYNALGYKTALKYATEIKENSTDIVTSNLAYSALNQKLDKSNVINSVVENSTDVITSGAVFSALENNQSIEVLQEILPDSDSPVASKALYEVFQGYKIRVASEAPQPGEVDEYTITFVF